VNTLFFSFSQQTITLVFPLTALMIGFEKELIHIAPLLHFLLSPHPPQPAKMKKDFQKKGKRKICLKRSHVIGIFRIVKEKSRVFDLFHLVAGSKGRALFSAVGLL
jgi:hypothetical protein